MLTTAGLILAAGHGTRLGELSTHRPKPMLPVCNQPLVRWALALLRHHGLSTVGINLHHLGEHLHRELGHDAGWGLDLHYSSEDLLLGTGGGIKALAQLLPAERYVVVNGKIVTDIDLGAVLHTHIARRSLATLVVAPHTQAAQWGAVYLDPAQHVTRLLDQQRPASAASSSRAGSSEDQAYLFTGVHILEREVLELIPAGPACIVRTAYQELLRRNAAIDAVVHQGYFYEHSTPARYLQGNLNLLHFPLPHLPAPGPCRGIDPQAEVDPSATIASSVLIGAHTVIEAQVTVGAGVVVGEHCHLAAGSTLYETVVWPHSTVQGRLQRAIVVGTQVHHVPPQDDPMATPR